MGSPRDDFDLLLAAPHPIEAELARGMLADAGIPVFVHGGDFDVAELGSATHAMLRRPDLYVPKGARERAEQVLREAGFEEPTALETADAIDPSYRERQRRWGLAFVLMWLLPIAALIFLIAVT